MGVRMAGDWIKLENVTPNKPEIFQMADLLHVSPEDILGRLVRLWVWADEQSRDGNALRVTESSLDRLAQRDGFAAAMRTVGWLAGVGGDISLPNFDRHNGQTAKTRALSNKRKQSFRERQRNGAIVPPSFPEKRREEKSSKEQKTSAPIAGTPFTTAQTDLLKFLTTTPPLTTIRNPARFVRHVTAAYPADWTLAELKKLMAWLAANPLREEAMRDWDRFVTNWLKKGWGDPAVREQIKAMTAGIGR